MQPVCGKDEQGLTAIPALDCPAGQSVIGIDQNGLVKCGISRAGDQLCPENQFVIGFDPNGSVICDIIPEPEVYLPVYRPQVLVCGEITSTQILSSEMVVCLLKLNRAASRPTRLRHLLLRVTAWPPTTLDWFGRMCVQVGS